MNDIGILELSYKQLHDKFLYISGFFESIALMPPNENDNLRIKDWFNSLDCFELEQKGIEKNELNEQFLMFIENMEKRFSKNQLDIKSITIIGGQNKFGEKENVKLTLKKGDVVSIVGPTGSGKSRLLADIEWLAQGDTPTSRQILINDVEPPPDLRFSIENKLVAQLSQNMNFVMDLSVGEFIKIHMESRQVGNDFASKTKLIINEANLLAGEPIFEDTPITALSGGQSRALMIADTAFLSSSPIVLIDEIENAGIDRKIAIELLIKSEKIVLIATHDPILALRADRRIVIKNGGISKIIETTEIEKQHLEELEELNIKLMHYREMLRSGCEINKIL